MKYMGSKNKLSKEILPIMLKNRKSNQVYVEPFVGGANMIDKVSGQRQANDIHFNLIEMYLALQRGWQPPEVVTEEMYNDIRTNQDKFEPALVGYVGFALSFGGKWFAGYRRDKKDTKNDTHNMNLQSWRSYNDLMKQSLYLKNVKFTNLNYWEIKLEPQSLIYCDPPYIGTTKYKSDFNHDLFYNWLRQLKTEGHTIFVSEYEMPDDFTCVWQKEVSVGLNVKDSNKAVEKLFTL